MTRAAVLWFTGLSGSGKSTVAKRVHRALLKRGLAAEYLDGDQLREIFPETGFTKRERDLHIRRVGYLASLLEKNGVFVVASFISPYAASRASVRARCRRFVEIHVATPLAVCEKRDVKGLYARARKGRIKNFTGISAPYEAPKKPELVIDTSFQSVAQSCAAVMKYVDAHLLRR